MDKIESLEKQITEHETQIKLLEAQKRKLLASKAMQTKLIGKYVKINRGACTIAYMHVTKIEEYYINSEYLISGPCISVTTQLIGTSYNILSKDFASVKSELSEISKEEFDNLFDKAIQHIKSLSESFKIDE